jgi:hypothetical protein
LPDVELRPKLVLNLLPHVPHLVVHPVFDLQQLFLKLHPQTLFLHCSSLEYLLVLHDLLEFLLEDLGLLLELALFLEGGGAF